MKFYKIHQNTVAGLAISSCCLLISCTENQKPSPNGSSSASGQSSKQPSQPSAQPVKEQFKPTPFKNEVYRAVDDVKVITLISTEELEINENGSNLVCKYSKQGDKLRIIVTAFGTTQAVYYRITDKGLEGEDGSILYSPSAFDTVMRRIAQARNNAALKQELFAACKSGTIGRITTVLSRGVDINGQIDEYDLNPEFIGMVSLHGPTPTPLTTAILHNSAEVVSFLLKKCADPNLRSRSGKTALMIALNRAEIVDLLCKHNADVNAQDDSGNTALLYACKIRSGYNLTSTVEVLMMHGANPGLRNRQGELASGQYQPLFSSPNVREQLQESRDKLSSLLLSAATSANGISMSGGWGTVPVAGKIENTPIEITFSTYDPTTGEFAGSLKSAFAPDGGPKFKLSIEEQQYGIKGKLVGPNLSFAPTGEFTRNRPVGFRMRFEKQGVINGSWWFGGLAGEGQLYLLSQ